jgi:hypothetical protein
MKIYTFCNDDWQPLKKRFLDTLQDPFEVVFKQGDFESCQSIEFPFFASCKSLALWQFKTEMTIDAIRDNQKDFIIISDIDIQFFKPIYSIIKSLPELDLRFQIDPDKNYNLGFQLIRCNEKTLEFYEHVLKRLKQENKWDQHIVNENLKYFPDLTFGFLPESFWAYDGKSPPSDIVLHHATWASTCEEKLKQMDLVKFNGKKKKIHLSIFKKKQNERTNFS